MKNRIREVSSLSIIRMMRFCWAGSILPRTPSTAGLISRWALPLGVSEPIPKLPCRHLLHRACKSTKCLTAATGTWCPLRMLKTSSSHHKQHRPAHYRGSLIKRIRPPPPLAIMQVVISLVQTHRVAKSTTKRKAISMDSRTRATMRTTKGSTQNRW